MKRPCIRGLKEFKKGCPEKAWNGSDGCPAWKEYTIPQDDSKPILIKDCIDCLQEHWQFESLKLLEGNQRATESFRNGMCEQAGDGQVYPKTTKALLQLAGVIDQFRQETRQIEHGCMVND